MMARRCFHQGPYGPTAGQIDPLELEQVIDPHRRKAAARVLRLLLRAPP
ncbi:MAG: hypothetical protein ACRDUV_00225 [Pseudonocardiaceae bacterium]